MSQTPSHGSVGVVIPTRNEAAALPRVLQAIPEWVTAVVVADHRSTDGTPTIARQHGAIVVNVDRPGYGRACLSAIAALPPVDIVVFVDGDASDDLGQFNDLVAPVAAGRAEMVIGSRTRGVRERGALTPQQVFGNWLACTLIRLVWRVQFTDLGPFRAIRRDALDALEMKDPDYGWTIEMQVKAARRGFRCLEIPAHYRQRIGTSKISGTLSGSIRAGVKILWVIAREALSSTGRTRTPRSGESREIS